ncbi:MAG: hypothetical protein V7K14_27335 [Nostoc sp.]
MSVSPNIPPEFSLNKLILHGKKQGDEGDEGDEGVIEQVFPMPNA